MCRQLFLFHRATTRKERRGKRERERERERELDTHTNTQREREREREGESERDADAERGGLKTAERRTEKDTGGGPGLIDVND